MSAQSQKDIAEKQVISVEQLMKEIRSEVSDQLQEKSLQNPAKQLAKKKRLSVLLNLVNDIEKDSNYSSDCFNCSKITSHRKFIGPIIIFAKKLFIE